MSAYLGAPDLTLPIPGSGAAKAAFSGALRERTKALMGTSFAAVPGCERASAILRMVLAQSPGALFAAMRRTSVHVHFEAARFGGADGTRHLLRGYASLLAELAVSEALPEAVTLAGPLKLTVRSQRETLTLGPSIRFSSGHIEGVQRRTPSFLPIDGDVCLALDDDNPLAMNEAHPDKDGNALSLGEHPESEWLLSLRDSLQRIETHLPLLRAEMSLGLSQVVPVGYEAEKHLSASYREALGTIYLTLHPDPMTMTEAVIHEFQHNKLNAALDLDPFLDNAFTETVSSPVRPDPRPLHGVLLAVHAFQPVAELYLRMREAGDPLAANPRFAERLSKVVQGNHEGLCTVLSHASPTTAGEALLTEMQAIDARHQSA